MHVQYSWRIEGPEGIVTGRSDLWKPTANEIDFDDDPWNYENGNLQDGLVEKLLGNHDSSTRSYVDKTDLLFVEAVEGDNCGGARLALSGGYRLV